MKKLMALVLSIGLVLLGTAPVMAAGQAAKAAPPAQQEQVVQVVVPEGEVLRTPQLLETSGQQWQQIAARGVQVIYRAGRAALNVTKKHPCITGCVVGHYLSKYVLDPVDRAASKAWDASKRFAARTTRKIAERSRTLLRNAARNSMLDTALWIHSR